MRTFGTHVEDYLVSLVPARELAMRTVRQTIVDALPAGYEETLRRTAIYYDVAGRPGRPLIYAGLASQRNYMTIYLRPLYVDPPAKDAFVRAWLARGRPLNMGKGCVRFQSLDDIDLDLVADLVSAYTPEDFVALWSRK